MDYYKLDDDTHIVCLLCHHHCRLKEDAIGMCGVNKNENQKLKTLVYGHPASIAIDPVEKKPIFHLLPGSKALSFGTVGCNFRCPFCQNWQLSQSNKIDTSRYISAQNMVDLAVENGCESIAYTYNEPTIFYPYARDIALLAKANGLKNIYVSNGYESRDMIDDMKGIIDAVNIDLKSFKEAYYSKTLKGGLREVLEGLKQFKSNGIWLEVTTLVVPGDNDSPKELSEMANFIAHELGVDTPWHLSAFHPDYKVLDKERTSIKSLDLAVQIAKAAGLRYVYRGNVAGHSNTYCPHCSALLIQRSQFGVDLNRLEEGKCPECHYKIEGVWR